MSRGMNSERIVGFRSDSGVAQATFPTRELAKTAYPDLPLHGSIWIYSSRGQ
jgi:hypothetical protein